MSTLYVVGLGPGKPECMTAEAMEVLKEADVIYGYTAYVDLVRPLFPDKDYRTTGMTQEIERCRMALETAAGGKTTALICSGDAGVYGMASPVLTLQDGYPDAKVRIVAGVTAALSGGAALGAPLSSDFCAISLSDLLTPWETIERRLKAAAVGDFSIALYNPASRKRKDHLQRACDILMENGKSPETVCGYVRNIGREGEERKICTLEKLRDTEVDMFTTVFIGTAETQHIGCRMVTPRGYEKKETNA